VLIAIESVCPLCPELGETETIWAGGLIVSEEVLPLTNWTPVDVEPAIDAL